MQGRTSMTYKVKIAGKMMSINALAVPIRSIMKKLDTAWLKVERLLEIERFVFTGQLSFNVAS